ncbi:MAG: hypothetical protein CMK04_07650 [Ponticaulis sp.]|nr:hypothetical protein [Ponticaulis sp.]RPG17413.1 MAG: ABC transporter substrate-binding protein [Hyphomonadaceae bacterium TMED125]|tara:strand:+ start:6265 stop:6939 length:675 start_codon:yes stop_codon:yes gene_type:complete
MSQKCGPETQLKNGNLLMKEFKLTRRLLLAAGAGLAMTATFGMSAHAQSDTDFRNVIDARLQAIEQILQRDLPADIKRQTLIQTTRPTIDDATLASGALGRNARTLSPNQTSEFAQIIGDMAALQEADFFLRNEGSSISVVNAEAQSRGRGSVLVQFNSPDGATSMLSYSLSGSNGGYLIYNFAIDGSNVGSNYRSAIGSLFNTHRGDANAVIADMAQRRDQMN